jgi:hypothetical protein
MARAGMGPIIPDRGSSKKPTAQPVRLTPNQSDRAAEAAKAAAAARAEAARQTKAQVERQERAQAAAKEAQIAKDRASSLAAFKASGLGASGFINMTDAKARAASLKKEEPVFKPTAPSSQPSPGPKAEVPESTGSGEIAAEPVSTGTTPTPTPAEAVVKSANIETILFNDEEFSSEFLVDLLFESVAGQELLTIARNDTVNGQDVVYQPFKNLNILQDTYNPTKLLAIYDTSESFFGAFAIDLRSKIPLVGTGIGGKNYYLTSLGDLVIEVVNIASDEQVEFQVADSGTIEELGI